MTHEELREQLRIEAEKLGGGTKLAAKLGISPAWLYKVISGAVNPGPKLLDILGYREERVLVQVRKTRRRPK